MRRRASSTAVVPGFYDMESVDDGFGVAELFIDGLLATVERLQRGDLHIRPETHRLDPSATSCRPSRSGQATSRETVP